MYLLLQVTPRRYRTICLTEKEEVRQTIPASTHTWLNTNLSLTEVDRADNKKHRMTIIIQYLQQLQAGHQLNRGRMKGYCKTIILMSIKTSNKMII